MTSREAPEHLWRKLASADEEVSFVAFEELVLHYQYLVEAIARKLEHRLPSYLEDDELLSLGQIGLLKALGKYDPEQGAFSKYASAVIWGAIIDGLRANDFAPRGLRKQQRDLDTAVRELKENGVTDPTLDEIAQQASLEVGAVIDIKKRLVRSEVTPTDPTLLPAHKKSGSEDDLWSRETCREFVVWLKKWDSPTQEVVLLKYWKGLSLRAISELLDEPFEVVRDRHQSVLSEVLPFMVDLVRDN